VIGLIDVHVAHRVPGGHRPVLNGASLAVRRGERAGILGAGSAGKSTVIRLLAGTEAPHAGHVLRDGSLTWPLGSTHGFHPHLSGAANIRLLAGIARLDVAGAMAFCEDFAELGPYWRKPVAQYSPGMRAQLAFSFSMCRPADFILADEVISAGDQTFRDKCEALLLMRLRTAGLVIVSKHARTLERYCTSIHALAEGRILRCEDVEEAADLVARNQRAAA
jgi:capsular polysaccharide transport system ATP-binding protein